MNKTPINYVNHKDNYLFTVIWLFVILFLTLLTLSLGISGYMIYERFSFLDAAHSTLRLFLLDFDAKSGRDVLVLEVARWSAVTVVFGSVLLFFVSSFYYYIKFLFYRFSRGTYIVIGLTDCSLELIKDLKQNNRRVVVITFDSSTEIMNKALNLGVVIVSGDIRDKRTYSSANIRRAERIIIFNESDAVNIECLMCVIETQLIDGPKDHYIIKIHINNQVYNELLNHIEHEYLPKLEINSFSVYRNMVDKAYEDLPFYYNYNNPQDKPPHVLIIGIGDLGIQFLEKTLQLGHFPGNNKMLITIVDSNEQKIEHIKQTYRSYEKYFILNYIHTDAMTYSYTQLAEESHIDYIVITLNNSNVNMMIADKIISVFQDSTIVARLTEHELLSKWINKNLNRYMNLHSYSITREIVSEEVVLNGKLENFGKMFHNFYQKQEGLSIRWEELSNYYKRSNITIADHSKVKLRSIGLQLVEDELEIERVITPQVQQRFENHKYILAESEHNRWCTFLMLNGYVWHEQRDDSLKRHPLLVDWDMLSDSDKQKNIHFVETMVSILLQKHSIKIRG